MGSVHVLDERRSVVSRGELSELALSLLLDARFKNIYFMDANMQENCPKLKTRCGAARKGCYRCSSGSESEVEEAGWQDPKTQLWI